MAKFRKVDVRVWGDEKFRALTPLPPSGQSLWLYLLTGKHTGIIPGVSATTDGELASQLRWDPKAFQEAFGEVFLQGMAEADWNAGVLFIPNALKHNAPASPNVVRSWAEAWDELPECPLKDKIWRHLKAFTEGLGEGFAKAFREVCRQPSAKALPNQEQEQEQEQETTMRPPVAQPPPEPDPGYDRPDQAVVRFTAALTQAAGVLYDPRIPRAYAAAVDALVALHGPEVCGTYAGEQIAAKRKAGGGRMGWPWIVEVLRNMPPPAPMAEAPVDRAAADEAFWRAEDAKRKAAGDV